MELLGKVLSVDKALLIVKLLAEKGRDMKLTEIAEELDINKSTLHGLISTLKFHGFVDQDAKTQMYRPGLYLIDLGDIAARSLDIIRISLPIIETVRDRLQETVHIAKLHNDNMDVIYVNKKESKQSMRIFTSIGATNPSYCTGVGKVLLAYLDENALERLLQRDFECYTPKTITDKEEFVRNLAACRRDGYAVDDEEYSIGLRCVAAPIFDHAGRAVYGISISGPTVRMTEEKMQSCITTICEAADNISRKIGYKN